MRIKSNFSWIALLLWVAISQFFCTSPTEKNTPVVVEKSVQKVDSLQSDNYATAQIALNIETQSNKTLAFAHLDVYALVNNKGKFKVKTLLVDDSEKGPFTSIAIIEKAVISKNNEIKVLLTYELQTQRIVWETQNGQLTGNHDASNFQQFLKSAGGSITGTATLIFDELTMQLQSQTSEFNPNMSASSANDADYQQWNKFAIKYLLPRLTTTINWINPTCLTKPSACTSSTMIEKK